MKAKAVQIAKRDVRPVDALIWLPRRIEARKKNANHLAACSCYSCGNPRKWFAQKTMQERRAE